MTKWKYISLISKRGNADGSNGGVLDLLIWSGKPNTASVTLEEAKAFWELHEHKNETSTEQPPHTSE